LSLLGALQESRLHKPSEFYLRLRHSDNHISIHRLRIKIAIVHTCGKLQAKLIEARFSEANISIHCSIQVTVSKHRRWIVITWRARSLLCKALAERTFLRVVPQGQCCSASIASAT
jgi:hypothetical protein